MPPRKTTIISKKRKVPSPRDSGCDADASAKSSSALGPTADSLEELSDMDEELGEPTSSSAEPTAKRAKTSHTRFNELKSFKGQRYTGMAIGGTHRWSYDSGQWIETKEEPDLWKFKFETKKHRLRNAPKNSGAPVGTEYHWLIVAHQYVVKEDANTYTTRMEGRKYKLAHKSVGTNSWSVNTVKGQREREVELLEDAKRRVRGLPPVISSQKVTTPKMKDPGQSTLDEIFLGASGKRVKRDGTHEEAQAAGSNTSLEEETTE